MSKTRKIGIVSAGARAAGLVALLAGGACATQPTREPPQQAQLHSALAAPDRPGPPEPLAPAARALLRDRMAAHARAMSDLMGAIMLLEYSQIGLRADDIASDDTLSRPTTNDATELNAQIPEKFFVRQDDLKAAAHNLAEASRTLNPYKVADAYGRLSETCVRCHADFRPPGPAHR
ncbi:MAG TPA: cytochrome c [Polyangia bacterium]|nr:cytochrome c [Polyangia bacterium]